ncbi:peptidase domain-containing ABC transporter [[Clostridium] polysaccharolyticum]|uniref:ATP-binding cassette, subfamily B n=1 Tax=[Clostridium] polysaccharolyticum TaxID=29364 RepID=A0A1I0D1A0_9FIRM|nr:peptidase domain-containing ABC transporter [[Clostridium] polysaccharolyticum]SET25939.1 ATP-binding cassette, subfamily B [[Clostridium] polysaccharolyticum]
MRYQCIYQQDATDCGAACLATIMSYYKKQVSIAQIREHAGTGTQGTSVYGLIQAAKVYKMKACAVKGDREKLTKDLWLPCIADVIVNDNLNHYVVIHKITKKGLIIADPDNGIVHLTFGEFFGEEKPRKDHVKYKWKQHFIFFTPEDDFEETRHRTNKYGRFFLEIVKQKKNILILGMVSLLCTALGVVPAFYYKIVMDQILVKGQKTFFIYLSIGIVGILICKIGLQLFRSYLVLKLSRQLDFSRMEEAFRKTMGLPMKFFHTRRKGDIISRLIDVFKVREGIISVTMSLLADSLMVLAGGILLFRQNRTMFAITAVVMLCYLFVVIVFEKSYEKKNKKFMESNSKFSSYLYEAVSGAEEIKIFQANQKIEKRYNRYLDELLQNANTLSMKQEFQLALKDLLELIGGILILWFGGLQVMSHHMSMGDLVVFYMLYGYFFSPVKNLASLQGKIQSATVALERIYQIYEIEPEIKTDLERSDDDITEKEDLHFSGDIEFRNVHFQYGIEQSMIEDMSFQIKKGEKVAFVGESGSGKTTIARLILQLYQPVKGKVLFDGKEIEDIALLRKRIAYISQDTFLFGGTVYENITLGTNRVRNEQVVEAAMIAQADEFIRKLPFGYDTVLGENGTNLSGGQKQRIAITRALLRNPDILILDEATSNLDSVTAKSVEYAFNKKFADHTRIIIAHKLKSIIDCDRIFVVRDGKIVESGTHKDLLETGKCYRQLIEQYENK